MLLVSDIVPPGCEGLCAFANMFMGHEAIMNIPHQFHFMTASNETIEHLFGQATHYNNILACYLSTTKGARHNILQNGMIHNKTSIDKRIKETQKAAANFFALLVSPRNTCGNELHFAQTLYAANYFNLNPQHGLLTKYMICSIPSTNVSVTRPWR